ncbi:MAG TPA: twin-arginine translocase subunit TatC [Acidimicrobiales bacterium]
MTEAETKRERAAPDAMTLLEHLAELRRRIIICAIAFTLAAIVGYIEYSRVLTFLRRPLCHADPRDCTLYVTGPLEGFGVHLDVAGYGGLALAAPVILFQLWRFVTPGLKASEKRYAIPFVVATLLLFATGVTIAWFTFPHALGFLKAASGSGIQEILSPQKYLNLLLALMALFGLTFEFPVVLVGLELAGVLTTRQLRKFRRGAIIIIVITSGVLTPSSDPFSMLAMAVPMLLFYEAAIIIGRLMKR